MSDVTGELCIAPMVYLGRLGSPKAAITMARAHGSRTHEAVTRELITQVEEDGTVNVADALQAVDEAKATLDEIRTACQDVQAARGLVAKDYTRRGLRRARRRWRA